MHICVLGGFVFTQEFRVSTSYSMYIVCRERGSKSESHGNGSKCGRRASARPSLERYCREVAETRVVVAQTVRATVLQTVGKLFYTELPDVISALFFPPAPPSTHTSYACLPQAMSVSYPYCQEECGFVPSCVMFSVI